jgi:O-antigen/teichoic acid export membrane protein
LLHHENSIATSYESTLVVRLTHQIGHSWQRIRQHTFLTNIGIYISSDVLLKSAQFLLLPVWAYFLTPADFGITGTMMAYGEILSVLLLLGLHGAVVRHYYDYEDNPEEQQTYLTSVLLFVVLFGGVAVGILSMGGAALWARLTGGSIPFYPYVPLTLGYAYLNACVQIPLRLFQARQQAGAFASIQIGKFAATTLTIVVLVVVLDQGAVGMLTANVIGVAVVGLLVFWRVLRSWLVPRVKLAHIQMALLFGLPLVPHLIAGWIEQASDRVILEHYVSLRELGLYNLGYMLGMAMHFLVMGINQAWNPYYYKLMKTDLHPEATIIRVVSWYVPLVGGVCLLGILFAGEFITLVLPDDYRGTIPYIGPVLLGYLMMGLYFFAVMPLFYYKKVSVIPLLTGLSASTNILLNLLLVPHYGAIAAAWTTAASLSLRFVLCLRIGRHYQRVTYPFLSYAILLGYIVAALFVARNLPTLTISAILVKSLIAVVYAGIAYFAVIRPYARMHPVSEKV